MKKFIIKALTLAIAFTGVLAAPAQAKQNIELDSQVFVERIVERGNRQAVRLEKPEQVMPGDNLIFILRYRNRSDAPADDFVITNPLPRAVAFRETLDGSELVSVNGGKSWGKLEDLRIAMGNGHYRPAMPSDVTHLRWNMANVDEGRLTFRGVVR